MNAKNLTWTIMGLVISTSACSAYQPAPVEPSHPAHPQGTMSRVAPRSTTLAYNANDAAALRTRPVALAQSESPAPTGQQLISAEGKIIAVIPGASQVVVEHGEIKGFMDAMTMGYRVEPASLLDGLKFGDKVRFTVDVPKKAIVKIEIMK